MRHIARIVPAVVFLIGLFVAVRRLGAQNAALGNVLVTGGYVVGGTILLFAAIIGVGKGLGRLVNRNESSDDDLPR